jgi:hypothetical protein
LTDLEPNETWLPHTIGQGAYPLTIDPLLPSDLYDIQMQLVRIPQNIREGESWSVGQIHVQPDHCIIPVSNDATAGNITYGNRLLLNSLDVKQIGQQLDINFHWLSLASMTENYKIFVHLIDPVTGTLVRQVDVMPVNWLYPTSLWWPGLEIKDRIPLGIDELQAGDYLLSIGVYDEITGERLQVVDAQGQSILEQALQIPIKIRGDAAGST